MTLEEMLAQLDKEGVENLRRAVEIGRWPNGEKVEQEQRVLCMQALIAWEQHNLPEEERSGYMPGAACESKSEVDDTQVIKGLE